MVVQHCYILFSLTPLPTCPTFFTPSLEPLPSVINSNNAVLTFID